MKLIFLDADGTLLHSDGHIPKILMLLFVEADLQLLLMIKSYMIVILIMKKVLN